MLYCRLYTIFQSTLPREERHFSLHVVSSISIFQSTLPREERPKFSDFFPILLIYFNPRSHERSDGMVLPLNTLNGLISIHAPTRGATYSPPCVIVIVCISIHAPTRGATHLLHVTCITSTFQSTLPREERQLMVSSSLCLHGYFNPRSHERSDASGMSQLATSLNFNPRSHERSDHPQCM